MIIMKLHIAQLHYKQFSCCANEYNKSILVSACYIQNQTAQEKNQIGVKRD